MECFGKAGLANVAVVRFTTQSQFTGGVFSFLHQHVNGFPWIYMDPLLPYFILLRLPTSNDAHMPLEWEPMP